MIGELKLAFNLELILQAVDRAAGVATVRQALGVLPRQLEWVQRIRLVAGGDPHLLAQYLAPDGVDVGGGA